MVPSDYDKQNVDMEKLKIFIVMYKSSQLGKNVK